MSELGKLSKECQSFLKTANDPKWQEAREKNKMAIEKIEKRQQQEKEERIQRKLDKLIKEEERKGILTFKDREEHIERLHRDANSSVQIDEEERIQRKMDERIKEMQEGATLTLREIWGEKYEEEMKRMRASEAITVRIEIRQEERELKLKEEKQKRAEERELKFEKERQRIEEIRKIGETQKIEKRRQLEEEIQEQVRKIGENPNKPLTMKDLYIICPGFDQETLTRACNDLNLEIAKRIAREAYPNKFK